MFAKAMLDDLRDNAGILDGTRLFAKVCGRVWLNANCVLIDHLGCFVAGDTLDPWTDTITRR